MKVREANRKMGVNMKQGKEGGNERGSWVKGQWRKR